MCLQIANKALWLIGLSEQSQASGLASEIDCMRFMGPRGHPAAAGRQGPYEALASAFAVAVVFHPPQQTFTAGGAKEGLCDGFGKPDTAFVGERETR